MAGHKPHHGFRVHFRAQWIACWVTVLLVGINCWAGIGGSVSGTVKDTSGAVIPDAVVTATNVDTGIVVKLETNGSGFYSFAQLSIGRYKLAVEKIGFRPYERTGITLDANSALSVDAILPVGQASDVVTVNENPTEVDTTSQKVGEVITGARMTTVPLNGRSFTDLLVLQPGVAPATSLTSDTVQDVGASALSPSGDLNPGTISINGQREFANSFIVNGSDVEEDVNMGAAVVPNLDAVAEFRILTNSFDAEYGEFSGGQINVVTKSGTNQVHGDVFEFLRNTNLDARNYFSPTRAAFHQNQFGGTFGAPIRKDKVFFFADYQGTRSTQGMDTGKIPIPSSAERQGNFNNPATGTSPLTGQVSGSYLASLLSTELGHGVSAGEPYYTPGCGPTGPNACVFPGAIIPQKVWSVPANNLLQYIPGANAGANTFATSAFNKTLRDDKGAYRLDTNSPWGLISGYYFLDDWSQDNPYPVAQGGANVPGFNALYSGRAQLAGLGATTTLSSTAVNELHFSYLRDQNDLGKPIGGVGVTLQSQGFTVGPGTPGIVPLSPSTEGVESVGFNSFTIGTNTNELKQVGNTFQWLDSFSKVIARHTLKAGAEFHYDQVNVNAIAQFNGSFLFFGTETGSDFADFLLGVPSQYNQSQLQPFYGRNKYVGLYAQDSWRITPSLVLNYGLRWDRIEPWYEKYNQIATFAPGKQSVVFPGAPAGILYPTDPGVPRTLAPPGNRDLAPRIGVAFSPHSAKDGLLAKILGSAGDTSIRASFGTFYTAIEALTIGVMSANAPYGTTYTSPAPPLFATPFITASNGQNLGQYFPVTLASLDSSASHPDNSIDWSQFEPITGLPNYARDNRIPYSEEYVFSIERGFRSDTVLSVNYVGNQGHHLLVLEEANPGDPSLCLALSNRNNLAPGQTPCGPFGEDTTYETSQNSPYAGKTFLGTRGPLGSNFGSNASQTTIGNSNYNSLQVTLRHSGKRLNVLAGYTYSKSLDQSSNLGEAVNPVNPSLSRALSSFDVRHNFIASYNAQLPVEKLLRGSNRGTEGWELSGIVHCSTGLPVTLVNYGDNSLLGTEPNGINNYGVDEPDYAGGSLNLNHDPRSGRPYFNTAQFGENALGTPGTARRRFFSGPGLNNYDMALLKNLRLSESKSMQFRAEAFNVFNHAQFFGPQSVDGNIANFGTTFGQVISAQAPRLVQFGFKFLF
jgi:hypothetical protein